MSSCAASKSNCSSLRFVGHPTEVGYLLADEFIEFGSSGRVYDKRQIIAALQQEMLDPTTRISLVDFVARRLAPEVFLVTYRTIRQDRLEFASAQLDLEIGRGPLADGFSSGYAFEDPRPMTGRRRRL